MPDDLIRAAVRAQDEDEEERRARQTVSCRDAAARRTHADEIMKVNIGRRLISELGSGYASSPLLLLERDGGGLSPQYVNGRRQFWDPDTGGMRCLSSHIDPWYKQLAEFAVRFQGRTPGSYRGNLADYSGTAEAFGSGAIEVVDPLGYFDRTDQPVCVVPVGMMSFRVVDWFDTWSQSQRYRDNSGYASSRILASNPLVKASLGTPQLVAGCAKSLCMMPGLAIAASPRLQMDYQGDLYLPVVAVFLEPMLGRGGKLGDEARRFVEEASRLVALASQQASRPPVPLHGKSLTPGPRTQPYPRP